MKTEVSIMQDYGKQKLLEYADSLRELADSFQSIISFDYRENEDKTKFMLMFTNLWEDVAQETVIRLANVFSDTIYVYRGDGVMDLVSAEDTWVENGCRMVRIPKMESHTFLLLMNE